MPSYINTSFFFKMLISVLRTDFKHQLISFPRGKNVDYTLVFLINFLF